MNTAFETNVIQLNESHQRKMDEVMDKFEEVRHKASLRGVAQHEADFMAYVQKNLVQGLIGPHAVEKAYVLSRQIYV